MLHASIKGQQHFLGLFFQGDNENRLSQQISNFGGFVKVPPRSLRPRTEKFGRPIDIWDYFFIFYQGKRAERPNEKRAIKSRAAQQAGLVASSGHLEFKPRSS